MPECSICKVEKTKDHDQTLRHIVSLYLSEGGWATTDPDSKMFQYLVQLAVLTAKDS